MIRTIDYLLEQYKDYQAPNHKINRLVKEGKIVRLKRGLYEDDPSSAGGGLYVAGAIITPSYLSFDYALRYYGLIPEAVYLYTSATSKKRHSTIIRNTLGEFSYQDIPAKAFPFGITTLIHGKRKLVMATPEKALCDKLYTKPPVYSLKQLKIMLFEDMRIEESDLARLDSDSIVFLTPLYGKRNLDLLAKLFKRKRKDI